MLSLEMSQDEFLHEQAKCVCVDVRTQKEFERGHIDGVTLNIPLDELVENGEIYHNDWEGKKVVCVCRTGVRSLEAANVLSAQGVDAYSLAGGYVGWMNISPTHIVEPR